uniref:PRA1 family protein n=1 Tax=Araucaria cunninghamii TaxID=56994 RepID=A0A0D6QX83_ARACU
MAFSANPLSLCIPQGAFESWLRESGYLEVIDEGSIDSSADGSSKIMSLLSINPFGKLTTEDLCKDAVPWTGEFFDCGLGPAETYSWPTSITQMKLRMEENLKRYTRNYIYLSLVILGCFLYNMPVALLGLVTVFALWDMLRICSNKWGLQKYPFFHQMLVMIARLATAVIMIYCNVALALCWAGIFSFVVLVVHSSLRKLTPLKQSLDNENQDKLELKRK